MNRALLPLLALLLGCEKVEGGADLLAPAPRRQADATPTSAPAEASPAMAAAPAPAEARTALPGALARLTLADPATQAPLSEIQVVATLPGLAPPRAIVRVGEEEWVVKPGGRIGAEGGVVTSISEVAVTAGVLEVSATGAATIRPVLLPAPAMPAPAPAAAADSPPAAPAPAGP